jgi:hypothetical protein
MFATATLSTARRPISPFRRRRLAEDRRVRAFVWAIRESAIPGLEVLT